MTQSMSDAEPLRDTRKITPEDVARDDNKELIRRYNYDEFTPEKVLPWMNFDKSPPVGRLAPSLPLWHLSGEEVTFSDIWSKNTYTIVEFGSFT